MEYIYDSGSPAADLIGTKLLLNIFISDAHNGARFSSMDLKYMFLHMELEKSEYMKVPYKCFPTDIKKTLNLDKIIHNDYVHIKTQKGMHGLKQATVLAYTHVSTPFKKFRSPINRRIARNVETSYQKNMLLPLCG